MKKIILLFSLLTSSVLFAQTDGFNYKALLTDNGNALSNHTINIRFTILENGTTNIYQETHSTTTDVNGITSVNIGEGVSTDDFSTIDWGTHHYFLKVEINTGTGYTDFGTSILKKVPFSKFADKAGNVFSGDFNDLSNIPTGLLDGDDNTQLTDAEITAMGYIKNPNDADHDATNELQTISKTGNTVTLSNGGGSITDENTTYTAGTGISIVGTNITNTGDTNAADDVQALNDLSDAKTTNYGIFLGNNSGTNAYVSGDLVALGREIMPNATSADYSIGIGNYALNNLSSGRYNTAFGYNAGYHNTTGTNNTYIGNGTGYNNYTGNGNIFIGHQAGQNETGSNKLYIDNSNISNPLIGGNFDSNEVTINGSIIIKDGTQVNGKVLVSDGNGKGHWSNNLPTQNKILDINQMEAVSTHQTDNIFQSINGATVLDVSSTSMYFPIKLPEGVMLQSVTVYYRDYSTNDLVISVAKGAIYSTNNTNLGTYNTSGSDSLIRYYTFTINQITSSLYWYYVGVSPKSGDHWNSNTSIRGIRIYYSE